jgi:AraC family transcriptional regulator, regulatory protein of adaptative response / DNA-3-methyladenine glycosylase II
VADAPHGLTHLFVSPEQCADAPAERIAALGMPLARARTLTELGRAVAAGTIRLGATRDVAETVDALQTLPGIGPWTAQYIAMRGLHWPDAFLPTDVGVRNALGRIDASATARAAEAWRPWRSYAVIHLWQSLAQTAE